jgi:hypothetical protein
MRASGIQIIQQSFDALFVIRIAKGRGWKQVAGVCVIRDVLLPEE